MVVHRVYLLPLLYKRQKFLQRPNLNHLPLAQPPLPPHSSHTRPNQLVEVVLKEHEAADPKVVEPRSQHCTDLGSVQAHADIGETTNPNEHEDEASMLTGSGSEMSLSSVYDTPIIHSGDNGEESV